MRRVLQQESHPDRDADINPNREMKNL